MKVHAVPKQLHYDGDLPSAQADGMILDRQARLFCLMQQADCIIDCKAQLQEHAAKPDFPKLPDSCRKCLGLLQIGTNLHVLCIADTGLLIILGLVQRSLQARDGGQKLLLPCGLTRCHRL